jgi:carboxymethylenebutenolidase
MTRRLAAEGYVALAIDLYDGSVAETPEQAQALMSRVVSDPQNARANLRQAYQYLHKYALSPKIGSIGWSFGGGWSLQAGLMLPNELDAVVMYSGQLVSDSKELAKLNMPLLGLFAESDESVPIRDVQVFRENLRRLGKPSQVLIYPHAKGGFAMPGARNYDAKAAADAWAATLAFLDQNLKSKPPP